MPYSASFTGVIEPSHSMQFSQYVVACQVLVTSFYFRAKCQQRKSRLIGVNAGLMPSMFFIVFKEYGFHMSSRVR